MVPSSFGKSSFFVKEDMVRVLQQPWPLENDLRGVMSHSLGADIRKVTNIYSVIHPFLWMNYI